MCHYQLSDCLRRPVFAAVERLAVRSSLKSVLCQVEHTHVSKVVVSTGAVGSKERYSDVSVLRPGETEGRKLETGKTVQ